MEVGFFAMPTIGHRSEIESRMAGKRTDLYQRMLKNLVEIAQYLDGHGYYGIGFTEHHFHIEGEEVSTNPILIDLYLGLHTKRLKVGQLGNVLPSQNPIRVAEDIAMLDQMTGGRAFAGFARGYQPRWVNVLGQQHKGQENSNDAEAYENLKRELHEEHFDIIMKAWSNDTFSHRGKHWQIPPPDIHWAAHEVTREYGQGVDEKGVVTEIGIAPPTFNKRIPDLFQPFSFSERSIKWAIARNMVPLSIVCDTKTALGQMRAAQQGAAEAGQKLKLGERMGIVRDIVVADTDAEAQELAKNAGAFLWTKFFQPFGFNAAITRPGEDPFTVENTFENICDRGLIICGSPETVNRKLEKLFSDIPCDYFWTMTYQELIPQKDLMRHLDLLTNKVLPNFTSKIR